MPRRPAENRPHEPRRPTSPQERFDWLHEKLCAIESNQGVLDEKLNHLHNEVRNIMATIQELQAQIQAANDASSQERTEWLAALSTLKEEIAALKAQIAAGSPATQQDLDDLGTSLTDLITKIQGTVDQADVG